MSTEVLGQLASQLIGGGINLAGASMTNSSNARQAAVNRAFQREERELQNQWNLDMWNMSNEYNDATSQMERMVAAGINPSAAAQGISGSPVSATPAQGSTPGAGAQATMQNPISDSLVSMIGNSVNTFWQNEKVKQEAEGQSIANRMASNDAEVSDALVAKRVEKFDAEVDKMKADSQISRDQAEILRSTKQTLIGKTKAELNVLNQQLQESIEKVLNMQEERKNLVKQREKMDSDIEVNEASIGLMESQKQNVDANTAKTNVDTAIANLDKDIKQVQRNTFVELGVDPSLGPVEKAYMAENGWLKAVYSAQALIGELESVSNIVGNVVTPFGIMKGAKGLQQVGTKYAPTGNIQNANPVTQVAVGSKSAGQVMAEQAKEASKQAIRKKRK